MTKFMHEKIWKLDHLKTKVINTIAHNGILWASLLKNAKVGLKRFKKKLILPIFVNIKKRLFGISYNNYDGHNKNDHKIVNFLIVTTIFALLNPRCLYFSFIQIKQ